MHHYFAHFTARYFTDTGAHNIDGNYDFFADNLTMPVLIGARANLLEKLKAKYADERGIHASSWQDASLTFIIKLDA